MHPQCPLISVIGWKQSRGCHFGSNGLIYIFNFTFLHTIFLMKKKKFFIIFYLVSFLIGSDWPPYITTVRVRKSTKL